MMGPWIKSGILATAGGSASAAGKGITVVSGSVFIVSPSH